MKLTGQQIFNLGNELGSLVVKDVGFLEGLDGLVLGIAAHRIHDGQEARHGRRRLFGRNQIDTFPLTPLVIGQRLFQQIADIGGHFIGRAQALAFLPQLLVFDGPGKRRGFVSQMVGNDNCPGFFSTDLDFNFITFNPITVHEGQSNGAHFLMFGLPGEKSDSVTVPVRNHGAAGYIADVLIIVKYLRSRAGHALVFQLKRLDNAR